LAGSLAVDRSEIGPRFGGILLYQLNDHFWPSLCEKSNIYSPIGGARKFNQLFVLLSEMVAAASKCSTLFFQNISSLQRNLTR
jgi:hypothetical protein